MRLEDLKIIAVVGAGDIWHRIAKVPFWTD